jgi:hypothetical protein
MTDNLTHQIEQLRAEIQALQQALANLAALPHLQEPLQAEITAKEARLAALQRTPPQRCPTSICCWRQAAPALRGPTIPAARWRCVRAMRCAPCAGASCQSASDH